jgi:calcium-dependent protein kinase
MDVWMDGWMDGWILTKNVTCCLAIFLSRATITVEILRTLDHPHIVKAIETFDYHGQLRLVLELCSGGDLYARDPYTEQEASGIVQGLMSAVAYLHSRNIVHRDLKFENIMFVSKSATAEVKIIDFGLSQKNAADTHLHDAVGTWRLRC